MPNKTLPTKILLFGSTGSIGKQTLEVVHHHPQHFQIVALSTYSNIDLLIDQALAFLPKVVVIGQEKDYQKIRQQLPKTINILVGNESLEDVVREIDFDILLPAVVGSIGLKSTYQALLRGKTVALANKESLVVAGEIMMQAVHQHKAKIIPVDSEHSAIFQCLQGEHNTHIEQLILTASGGPFRGKKRNFVEQIRAVHALNHPVWKMGKKISIDSATLMNKGLEVIEAKWLFNLEVNQIDVVIHPQCVVHSIVQFVDGSMKAQMSNPDMRLPIQYALFHPIRKDAPYHKPLNLLMQEALVFEPVDHGTFPNLNIAIEAIKRGGNMPCILNKANEILVDRFLNDDITFYDISDKVLLAMNKVGFIKKPTIQDLLETEEETHDFIKTEIKNCRN